MPSRAVVIYDKKNKLKMTNIYSSLSYHFEDIEMRARANELHEVVITDKWQFFGKKAILVLSDVNQNIKTIDKDRMPIMIQYESKIIKECLEEKYPDLIEVESVIVNAIPEQKKEIEPLETQTPTIFYQGKDKPEDMVDLMFSLDTETHFEILFYPDDTEEEPSKKHKLSWCVTKNKNNIGIIDYKTITEIENGCLPILIKEYMPQSFFAYPFYVELKDLDSKELLVNRVKEISSIISKFTRDEFASFANAIYNGIYINSKWKYNYFLISEKIRVTLD